MADLRLGLIVDELAANRKKNCKFFPVYMLSHKQNALVPPINLLESGSICGNFADIGLFWLSSIVV